MKRMLESIKLYKNIGIVISCFICALYAFFMINQLTNVYDGFWQQSYYKAGDWETSCGRWLWPYVDKLLFGIHLDPLTTLISIAIFTFGFLIVLNSIDVKSSLIVCALGGILVFSSPIFSSIMAYRFMSEIYALSFLLVSLATYFLVKIPNNYLAILLGAVCVCLSMGLYQAYIGAYALVGIIVVFRMAVDDKTEINAICNQIIRYLFGFFLGGGLYYVLLHLVLLIKGINLTDYNGASGISVSYIIRSFPKSMKKAYLLFAEYIGNGLMKICSFDGLYFRTVLNALLIAALLAIVIFSYIRGNKKVLKISIAIICIIIMPLGINVATLLAPDSGFMPQMGFPMALFTGLIFLYVVDTLRYLKELKGKYIAAILLTIGAIFAYGQSIQVLTDHGAMYDGYVATKALANGVVDDLRRQGILNKEKSYFFIGNPGHNEMFYRSELYEEANEYAKVGVFWLEQNNMYAAYKTLFQRVVGVDLNVLSDPYESKAYDDYFKTVPCYPHDGYITNWDTVIIKISEP